MAMERFCPSLAYWAADFPSRRTCNSSRCGPITVKRKRFLARAVAGQFDREVIVDGGLVFQRELFLRPGQALAGLLGQGLQARQKLVPESHQLRARFDQLAREALERAGVGRGLFEQGVAGAQGGGVALQQGKIDRVRLAQQQIHKTPPQPRRPFDQLHVLGAKDHRAQRAKKVLQLAHRFAVQAQLALAGGPVDFDFVRGARDDPRPDEVALAAVPDELGAADAAKGAQGGQQVNGFQDVGFSLGIVAQQDMEAGSEVGLQTSVIAKIAQPEMSQMHGHSIQNSSPDASTNRSRPSGRRIPLLSIGSPDFQ